MEKRERVLFGLKSVVAFFCIMMVLNMNPINELNIWMQMAIGGLIALVVNDVFDKLFKFYIRVQAD